MKRKFSIAAVLAVTLLFGVWIGGAAAYTFDDTTLVQWWKGNAASGQGWSDVIGNANIFDTFGADLVNGDLTIYTNWNPGKDTSVSSLVKTADLFLYGTNLGDVAIQLDTKTGTGNVYYNPVAETSVDVFQATNLYYGGRNTESSPTATPVLTLSYSSLGSTAVVWSSTNANSINNQVFIDLTSLGITSFNSFVWGTATCSNDAIVVTPIPGSLVLLGSGVLALVGMGLRKKRIV